MIRVINRDLGEKVAVTFGCNTTIIRYNRVNRGSLCHRHHMDVDDEELEST
jgi:hypothetical protein